MPAERTLVFARRPVPGRVKTRLTPPLRPEDAAAFYAASLDDVLELAAGGSVEIWYDGPDDDGAYFAERFPATPRRRQPPGDLGQRMAHAVATAFAEGAGRVVVLGTDSPTLPPMLPGRALEALEGADVVLGPAEDGGYYLVALPARAWPRAAAVFRDVAWSTETVLETTVERARDEGLTVHLLPSWYDVDRVEDLRRAARDARPDSGLARWLASPSGRRYIRADER